MKKKTLFATVGAGLSLALAGVAVAGLVNANAVQVGASSTGTEAIALSSGTTGTNIITYSGNSCVMTINKGTSSNFYTSSVSAPRIYQKNYLRFEANANYVINSIVVTYTGTYTGASWAGQTSATAGGASASVTTALDPTNNSTALTNTWTFTATDVVSVTLINGVAGTSPTNTQLRPTAVSVNYTFSGTSVAPTSITISGTNTVAPGASTNLSAVVYGEGGAQATVQTVTWSLESGSENGSISAGGTVVGLNAGTIVAKATSTAASTVSATYNITVSASSATVYDKTLMYSDFANAYTDGYQTVGGIAYNGVQVLGNTSYKEVVLGKNAGSIYNGTAMPANLKKITLTCYNTPTVSVTAGTSNSAFTTAITATTSGSVYTYDFTGGSYKYFKIANGSTSATAGFYSIVIELVNTDVEAARTWATNFLSATSVCDSTGAADNITSAIWTAQSDAYTALNAAAKTALTGEACLVTVTGIQNALARYKYIVNKYGTAVHANFLGITVAPAASINETMNADAVAVMGIAVVSVLGLLTLAGVMVVRKKHN